MAPVSGLYTPPDWLIGKTPSNTGELGGPHTSQLYGGRAEELAALLGIGVSTPFENRAYALVGDINSQPGEWLMRSGWTQTSPYAGAEATLAAGKPIVEQAYAERQRQLEGEKDPLMARYQALLDELTRREGQDIGQTTLAQAREYGKRGVPLSSGVYEQNILEKTRPIREFYGAQGKEVGFEREDKLRELGNLLSMLPIEKAKELNMIDQQIANLKAKGASEQLQMAWEAYKFQREEYWKQQELDLKKQEYQLQYGSFDPSSGSLYDLFQSRINENKGTTTKKSLQSIVDSILGNMS